MDVREQFDRAIDALGRVSLLAQLQDKVVELSRTGRRECGNCEHWMKRVICPHEPGIGSGKLGPSCGSLACGKFEMKASTKRLIDERFKDALDFAEKHGLPIPPRPRVGS